MVNDVYPVRDDVCAGCRHFAGPGAETNSNGDMYYNRLGCQTTEVHISISVPAWCDRLDAHRTMRMLEEL